MAVIRRKDSCSSSDSNLSSVALPAAAATSQRMLSTGRKLQEEEEEGLIDAAAAAAAHRQHQPALPSCRTALLLPPALLIAIILFLLLPSSSSPAASLPSWPVWCCAGSGVSYHPRLKLVSVGDSITEFASRPGGWLTLLADNYTRKADVYNRGYAGYNTRHYLHLLRHHLQLQLFPFTPAASSSFSSPAYQQLVTLFLGTNDAALPDSGTAEANISVPLAEYAANLRQIVAVLLPEYAPLLPAQTETRRGAAAAVASARFLSSVTALILITPPQLNLTQWQLRHLRPPYPPLSSLPVTRSLTACQQYVAAVRELAASWSIPLVDLWSLTAPSPAYDTLSDGLHLNGRGNELLYAALLSVIRTHYPTLMPEMLHLDGPLYREIDAANVAASFSVKA